MNLNLEDAVYYHEGAFPPKVIQYEHIIAQLTQATEALARYDQELKSLHNPQLFLTPLRNQETVASSRMEGTISTVDEILAYDSAQDLEKEPDPNVRHEVIETILYRRTLNLAQKEISDGKPINDMLIRSMHQMLLSTGRGESKDPGMYRAIQNYVGDERTGIISYVPISPEKLPEGMERLLKYMSETKHTNLIRTALSHVEFEALHPFKDGNGRIGRILITLMLWSGGAISSPHFYISRYMEENKDAYIGRMRNVSADLDWIGWLAFFLKAIEEQANYNLEVMIKIRDLYEEMKSTFSEVTGSKHAISFLDAVFTFPFFENKQISRKANIPLQSVNRFTRALLNDKRELLKTAREGSGRRAGMFYFEPLLKIIRI